MSGFIVKWFRLEGKIFFKTDAGLLLLSGLVGQFMRTVAIDVNGSERG